MSSSGKDRWDKAEVVLKPVGGLLAALAVAWLGLFGRSVLEERQRADAKTRLYAQLMTGREQADSSLRQSMFNTIIEDFLALPSQDARPLPEGKPKALAGYEREVLKLEVLAYNFHDALDLGPLFKDVYRRLSDDDSLENEGIDRGTRDELIKRVQNVAVEVNKRQVAALQDTGAVSRSRIDRQKFEEEGILPAVDNEILRGRTTAEDDQLPGRLFKLEVLEIVELHKEVLVRLVVWALDNEGNATGDPLVDVPFNVGFFDFPMIDNTRLGGGDRCAVVLTELTDYSAELTLVYFPGSRASLKQKPFYDEVIDSLRLEDADRRGI